MKAKDNVFFIFSLKSYIEEVGVEKYKLIGIDDKTDVFIFEDFTDKDNAIKKINSYKYANVYIVLHKTPQKSQEEFYKELTKNTILQNHIPGDFFYSILPLIKSKECETDNLLRFFNFYINEELKELHEKDLAEYNKTYNINASYDE